MTNINIRVDGPTLKSLLTEDALLKLDSFAFEKIAEEITRKIVAGRADQQIRVSFEKAQADIMAAFKDRWKFPKEAKDLINALAKEAIEAAFSNAKRDVGMQAAEALKAAVEFQKKAMEHWINGERAGLFEAIAKEFNARQSALIREVKEQARTEFLDVLKEAKAAGL